MSGKALYTCDVSFDVAKVMALLGALPNQMRLAARQAVRASARWANKEGARGLAKHLGLPLRVLKKGLRLKVKVTSKRGIASASLWYGLNAIPEKYLSKKPAADSFVVVKSNSHFFKRAGRARFPLIKQEKPIVSPAEAYLSKFESLVQTKFIELFFEAIDKATGKETGTSQSIAG